METALEAERGECGDLAGHVVVAGAFAADGGDGEDEVADLGFLQAAALSQEQDGLGLHGREQVHHGGRHGASHAEIEDCQVFGCGGLHGMVAAGDFDAEPLGKQLDVLDEVTQKDELTEFLERASGVPWQPISDDVGFGLHDVGTRGSEGRPETGQPQW